MKEIVGNLWDYHPSHWIVITTNGFVKTNGECVMGRGCALEAKQKYPQLPSVLGKSIKEDGNVPFAFVGPRILTLPVKHNWWEKADLQLIETSLVLMTELVSKIGISQVVLPRPGCGNGQLEWEDVRPICEKYLDDRYSVITFA